VPSSESLAALTRGVNLTRLDVLGHELLVTTQFYTRLTVEYLEEEYVRRRSLQRAVNAERSRVRPG
jgi:site-specific recombinase XerC